MEVVIELSLQEMRLTVKTAANRLMKTSKETDLLLCRDRNVSAATDVYVYNIIIFIKVS